MAKKFTKSFCLFLKYSHLKLMETVITFITSIILSCTTGFNNCYGPYKRMKFYIKNKRTYNVFYECESDSGTTKTSSNSSHN